MATTTKAEMKIPEKDLHAVPLTLEGSSVLHQMFRFRWAEWRKLNLAQQHEIAAEASAALLKMENDVAGQTALFSLLGHKGDLLVVHFRNSFDQLKAAELAISGLRLSDYLEQTTSYLSVVELGLYDSSVKLYRTLREQGTQPHSPEWNEVIEETIKRQTEAMRPRLFPQIPPNRYICFYPMTAAVARTRTGTACPLKSASARWKSMGSWAAATPGPSGRSLLGQSALTIGSGAWTFLPTTR